MVALGKYLQIALDIPVGGGEPDTSHGNVLEKGTSVNIAVSPGQDVQLSVDAVVTFNGPGHVYVHENHVVSRY